jgi:hypothetical protein
MRVVEVTPSTVAEDRLAVFRAETTVCQGAPVAVLAQEYVAVADTFPATMRPVPVVRSLSTSRTVAAVNHATLAVAQVERQKREE